MDLRNDGRWPAFNHVVCESRGPRCRATFVAVDSCCEFGKGRWGAESELKVLLKCRKLEWGSERLA